ncbi:hypothetical protein LMG27952_03924 [Paraburkholderia hiiakae]|uniref:Uncharacterized protein n=2 Tax=Paraburkholderia hiiakae TaxID=1081782 RepID=A0ABN7HXP0_9BURK|nr:hypothetical protein LMG27952_03924 [Paraburkholderia hiiakae]
MKPQRSKHRNARADRYAELAMSTLKRCDVSIAQFRAVSLLAANILRNPAITVEDRANERTALLLLLDTAENYTADNEAWRELVEAVARDARRLPDVSLSADEAFKLMDEAPTTLRRSYIPQGQPA